MIDRKLYRTELVSFAIDEEVLQLARERVSGGLGSDDDAELDTEALAAELAASTAANALEAAVALRTERFESLATKHEAGKQREAAKKQRQFGR